MSNLLYIELKPEGREEDREGDVPDAFCPERETEEDRLAEKDQSKKPANENPMKKNRLH